MKVLKFIFPLLFVFSLPQLGFGQTSKPDSTNYVPKWEAGLDLLGLFNENNVPKASIFLRRNYAISDQKCRALRLRIGLDSELRDGYKYDGLLLGEYTTYAPYVSIGHEWKHVFKRYSWYFATDISGKYIYSNQYYLVSGDDSYYDVKIRDFDVTLHGILGYQVNLNRNLAIGVESAIILKYSEQHSDIVDNDRTTFGGGDYSDLTASINPILTLNLIYSLQKNKKNGKK